MRTMRATLILAPLIAVLLAAATALAQAETPPSADDQRARQIDRLVRQLDDDRAAQRDAAEAKLLELAGTRTAEVDRFLELLPEASDEMPLAVRERLTRIRHAVEDRAAKAATTGTTVTLGGESLRLDDACAAILKQTGNRLAIRSDDEVAQSRRLKFSFQNEPFWSAVDQILDAAGKDVYNYAGDNALSIVDRDPDDGPRFGRACYRGPFRLEVLEVQAQRSLRSPQRKSLKLQLEIGWEPRLRPIALSQPAADLRATDENGNRLQPAEPEAVLDVEVPTGTQGAEIVLPFVLPPRDVTRIASLRGKLRALVPGRQAEFRFDDLDHAAGKTQRRGGVQVTLDSVRKNNAVWEVHMRLRLDEDNQALQSHRGWVFQNVSYLVGKDGKPIENVGLETTHQSPNEVGIAYLFDLPDGIDGLAWVYETPAAIVELPVEYELTDIALP
jgi:hypothetical protein